jgi:hypothetical protein
LPAEIWAHIMDIRAAISIQSHYKAFKVRIGPLRFVLKYIRKGVFVQTRAAYWRAEQQARGDAHGHTLIAV